ncbi:hypothetical protein FQN54_001110 [Arachnomyces sp. PD_36]|nr:hypothetical protein FQN54_001110 [Arachnomyces sp. PD_36]
MSNKPIFVATHPRACSTAFERVFMTRSKTLKCIHEPFGDAFYFGPERLSERYEEDVEARVESGFGDSTYKTIFDRIDRESSEGKRLFIKDIIHYLCPPDNQPASIAPSLMKGKRGVGTDASEVLEGGAVKSGSPASTKPPYPYDTPAEKDNPTVVPTELLSKFHFAFLIRDPHYSIPSYYRCTIPPLDEMTGFYEFHESESGYDEVRRVFDYLRKANLVGPGHANHNTPNETSTSSPKGVEICVVDADDLLDNPAGIIKKFCESVGYPYDPDMLNWDSPEDHEIAKEAFEKWKGFHEDAIDSSGLEPRLHKKPTKTEAEFDADWCAKYGEEGARIIRSAVDRCMPDYRYMKKFTMKV